MTRELYGSKRPLMVLAPMDDVTDTVFRQVIASTAAPDLFFTEFVNVDGLQSIGRSKLLPRLQFTATEQPLIAQIWGKSPENFYKTARAIANGSLIQEIEDRLSQQSTKLHMTIRKPGLSIVPGSEEERERSTGGTSNEYRTKLTKQDAKSNGGITGSASKQAIAPRFSGLDINFGCPDKNVVRNGTCSAFILPANRTKAGEIIQACYEGLNGAMPLSVKTRLGFSDIDLSWHEFLLHQPINMLTIHGRTRKEMSKVPAHWDVIGEVAKLKQKLAPETLIIGNGDVLTRKQALALAKKYKLDGIMIGRGIFQDPHLFAEKPVWAQLAPGRKLELFKRHAELFKTTWQNNERAVRTINKFAKLYINGFDGAKELRENFMASGTIDELLAKINTTKL